jgi:hypothetical protein
MTDSTNAAFSKMKQSLSSIFYYCLSPPPCQAKKHKPIDPPVIYNSNKQQVIFSSNIGIFSTTSPTTRNKMLEWRQKKPEQCSTKQQYIVGIDDDELQ